MTTTPTIPGWNLTEPANPLLVPMWRRVVTSGGACHAAAIVRLAHDRYAWAIAVDGKDFSHGYADSLGDALDKCMLRLPCEYVPTEFYPTVEDWMADSDYDPADGEWWYRGINGPEGPYDPLETWAAATNCGYNDMRDAAEGAAR